MFSGESIILPEGCRERRLRALPRQAARLADRHCPYRPAGRPQAGSQPGNPGEAKRDKGNTAAFLLSARSDVLARYQDFSNPG